MDIETFFPNGFQGISVNRRLKKFSTHVLKKALRDVFIFQHLHDASAFSYNQLKNLVLQPFMDRFQPCQQPYSYSLIY